MRQQTRALLVEGHKLTWLAQGLTDDDGNVVIEERLRFRIDGRPLSDSDGEAILERLGYV
jgi:hypothetical protein